MTDKAWTDSEELDRLFDEEETDILQHFDTGNRQYPGQEPQSDAKTSSERDAEDADLAWLDEARTDWGPWSA